MDNLTPQQTENIQTWTEQRDNLLKEISVLETEKETLQKTEIEKAQSLDAMRTEEIQIQSRLAAMDLLENRRKISVTHEITDLETRKSRLETECEAKQRENEIYDKQKIEKMTSIELLSMVGTKISDQSKVIEETVGSIVKQGEIYITSISEMMTGIENISTQVIDKSNKNIDQTNIVLEKLPRYIFELEKPIPLRRTFAEKKGAKIEPEQK